MRSRVFQQAQSYPFLADIAKFSFDCLAKTVLIRGKRKSLPFPQREHERFHLFSAPGEAFSIGNRFCPLSERGDVISDAANVGVANAINIAACACP